VAEGLVRVRAVWLVGYGRDDVEASDRFVSRLGDAERLFQPRRWKPKSENNIEEGDGSGCRWILTARTGTIRVL
jgi:hypothetical protein